MTETIAHAGKKARKLRGRGVRRVFAIDVDRGRCREWSVDADGWEILGPDAAIEDPALVRPLSIHDLVSAGSADDAFARALLAKRNAVIEEALETRHARGHQQGREQGRTEAMQQAIVTVLCARGLAPSAREQADLFAATDAELLTRWLVAATSCTSVAALLASR